ncbi:hypothetical protein LTR91_012622 [Friedmanniomyces endolithicus]|uniref:Uncharacterized protein n=1 Tax=Friedmanniomyces endolithicus TaxID=329885 RepID=A0AAN6QRH2_9PEZI|nr:hypothetical protein LTR94_020585 [Friedmanniomyces endolithicus]KAK0788219.1 hypothetical protein LTR38_011400 [Friedmanniomyces endolithicus]KAK0801879.1 hypothetical protein LTR59_005233 [Friedmanniomyces endolithicus]KAK0817422.1 hypothetical protein LTR75_003161 [Friedmanniomyces endolithicus]KAK0847510.1 hypothetical protein LTR03_006295 [Friedmanniomyces endolithicus]
MNLTDLIHIIPPDRDEEPEDIFASAPGLIFTDDTRNQHGDPGSIIVYKSKRFGDIELRLWTPSARMSANCSATIYGTLESKRPSSSAVLRPRKRIGVSKGRGCWSWAQPEQKRQAHPEQIRTSWRCTADDTKVFITDYPAPAVLANIRCNSQGAVPPTLAHRYSVEGHEWGDLTTAFARSHAHSFTRIIAADCFWMSGQHESLVQSMLHFLTVGTDGKVFVVSGFHTGRAKLASFFEAAVGEGLEIEEIYEEDVYGSGRIWESERNGGIEDVMERKRWLVIAQLKRRHVDCTVEAHAKAAH